MPSSFEELEARLSTPSIAPVKGVSSYDQLEARLNAPSMPAQVETEPDFLGTTGAALHKGIVNLGTSALRLPEAGSRIMGGVADSLDTMGLPDMFNVPRAASRVLDIPAHGFDVGDYHVGGMSDLADEANQGMDFLSQNVGSYGNVDAKGQLIQDAQDKAFQGDFSGLGDVLTDPTAISSTIAQALPSLAAAMASGGSLPFMATLEGSEQLSNINQHEKQTGIPVSDTDAATAIMVQAGLGGMLEKIGFDAMFKRFPALNGMMAKAGIGSFGEGITEASQAVVGNAAEKYTYNEDASLTEGMLAGVIGGAGLGGVGGAASSIAQNTQVDPPAPQQAPVQNVPDAPIQQSQDTLSLADIMGVDPVPDTTSFDQTSAPQDIVQQVESILKGEIPSEAVPDTTQFNNPIVDLIKQSGLTGYDNGIDFKKVKPQQQEPTTSKGVEGQVQYDNGIDFAPPTPEALDAQLQPKVNPPQILENEKQVSNNEQQIKPIETKVLPEAVAQVKELDQQADSENLSPSGDVIDGFNQEESDQIHQNAEQSENIKELLSWGRGRFYDGDPAKNKYDQFKAHAETLFSDISEPVISETPIESDITTQQASNPVENQNDVVAPKEEELQTGNEVTTQKGNALPSKSAMEASGSTVQEVTSLVSKKYKGVRLLLDDGEVKIIQSAEDLPDNLDKAKHQGDDGLFDPETNTTYILADSVNKDNVDSVVMHELTHRMLKLNPNKKKELLGKKGEFTEVFNKLKNGTGKSFYEKAIQRIPKDTPESDVIEEAIAYTLSEYNKGQTLPIRLKRWAQEVIAMIRKGLRKAGIKFALQPADIQAMVKASMAENKAEETSTEKETVKRSVAEGPEVAESESEFTVADEGKLEAIRRKFQDKFIRVAKTQKAIEESGGTISDDANVKELETLFHGKTENDLRKLEEFLIEPLTDYIGDNKLDANVLDQYLVATHAEERNDYIASINGDMQDGGSGIKTADANNIIQTIESTPQGKAYKRAAELARDISKQTRDVIKRSGLEGDDVVETWESQYKNYVPLKGFAMDQSTSKMPSSGRGFNIPKNITIRALGRNSMADSPLANIIADATNVIVRNRKNEVGNALLKLAKDNPNKEFWEVFDDEHQDISRVYDKNKDEVLYRKKAMGMLSREYFIVKKGGKTFYVKLHDELFNRAMNNLGLEEMSTMVQMMGAATRFLSTVNTSLNPEFILSNFSRDIQTALYNMAAEKDIGVANVKNIVTKMVKDVPTAMRAVYRGLRGKEITGEYQQYFQDFLDDGAKTGYFDVAPIEEIKKNIEHMVNLSNGSIKGKGIKAGKAALKFIDDVNGAVENAIRLSAYTNLVKAGVSRQKAANLAKNLTVNFNQRGEATSSLNAFYMFFNASVQGVTTFARALGTPKMVNGKRRPNGAQKIAMATATFAYVLQIMNREWSDEDDDGIKYLDKIPGHVRERNIIIMKASGKDFWKIPLPYGYNIFFNLGTMMNDVIESDRDKLDLAKELMSSLGTSFLPIGISESESYTNALAKTISPSVMTPFTELAVNDNFFGARIYNDNRGYGTPKPLSSMPKRNTPQFYKNMAEWLNDATGGNYYVSGGIDISPDQIKHIVDYTFGGLGRFASKTENAIEMKSKGLDLEDRQIPFYNKISGELSNYDDQSDFYDRATLIKQHAAARKHLSGEERESYNALYGKILSLRGEAKRTWRQLGALNKRRNRIEEDQSLSDSVKDKRLKKIMDDKNKIVDKFNKKWIRASKP